MKTRLPLGLTALLLTCSVLAAADAPAAAPAPAASAPAAAVPATGPGAPASEASIKELLELTHARRLVEGLMPQLQNFAAGIARQASQSQKLTDAQKKAFDDAQAANLAVYKQELSWDRLEPMYIEIYEKSFTQGDIDGIVAFYKTPAGQALLDKLPLVIKNTMSALQQRTAPMAQRIQKETQDALKAAVAANPAPAPAAAAAPSPTPVAK